MKDGLRSENCLQAYYNFRDKINSRKDYYHQEYDCLPHFKAGVNGGRITVTEVGKYKKEIAYHGDTINIAARIQGKCNELGKDFLISENLRLQFPNSTFLFEEMGSLKLRGKQEKVEIYAVEHSE